MTKAVNPGILDAFQVAFQVELRLARAEDIPRLEWFGQYVHFRRLYQQTYAEQKQGRRLMLLAVANGFPIGQVFIHLGDRDVSEPYRQRRAYLYSLRVLEPFQGRGIGTRLILEAEAKAVDAGYKWAAIAVGKDNAKARRLYERLGYVVFGDDPGRWQYTDHTGKLIHVEEPSWMLQKRLMIHSDAGQGKPNGEE